MVYHRRPVKVRSTSLCSSNSLKRAFDERLDRLHVLIRLDGDLSVAGGKVADMSHVAILRRTLTFKVGRFQLQESKNLLLLNLEAGEILRDLVGDVELLGDLVDLVVQVK